MFGDVCVELFGVCVDGEKIFEFIVWDAEDVLGFTELMNIASLVAPLFHDLRPVFCLGMRVEPD